MKILTLLFLDFIIAGLLIFVITICLLILAIRNNKCKYIFLIVTAITGIMLGKLNILMKNNSQIFNYEILEFTMLRSSFGSLLFYITIIYLLILEIRNKTFKRFLLLIFFSMIIITLINWIGNNPILKIYKNTGFAISNYMLVFISFFIATNFAILCSNGVSKRIIFQSIFLANLNMIWGAGLSNNPSSFESFMSGSMFYAIPAAIISLTFYVLHKITGFIFRSIRK